MTILCDMNKEFEDVIGLLCIEMDKYLEYCKQNNLSPENFKITSHCVNPELLDKWFSENN